MTIGFVGLGVMGEPMCRNLAGKRDEAVLAFDQQPAPLARLAGHGVRAADGLAALAAEAEAIFMALPSGRHVQAVCEALLPALREGTLVVDLGTSPVGLTRDLAQRVAGKGGEYADAPIARTRQAAEEGTLAIMVGASDAVFARARPYLACMGSEITHCGPVGAGQIAKIMNNMVVAETVVALCEAVAVARRAGLQGGALLETLSKGSADSFVLRNHGLKAVVPGVFPERAFSVEYMLKDLRYALDLAQEAGLTLRNAALTAAILEEAIAAGDGALYWPVIARVIDRG